MNELNSPRDQQHISVPLHFTLSKQKHAKTRDIVEHTRLLFLNPLPTGQLNPARRKLALRQRWV